MTVSARRPGLAACPEGDQIPRGVPVVTQEATGIDSFASAPLYTAQSRPGAAFRCGERLSSGVPSSFSLSRVMSRRRACGRRRAGWWGALGGDGAAGGNGVSPFGAHDGRVGMVLSGFGWGEGRAAGPRCRACPGKPLGKGGGRGEPFFSTVSLSPLTISSYFNTMKISFRAP